MKQLDIKTTSKLRKKSLVCSSSFVRRVQEVTESVTNTSLSGSIDWNYYIEPLIDKKIEHHRKLMMDDPMVKYDMYLSVTLFKKMKDYDMECQKNELEKIDWNQVLVDEHLRVATKIMRAIDGNKSILSSSLEVDGSACSDSITEK